MKKTWRVGGLMMALVGIAGCGGNNDSPTSEPGLDAGQCVATERDTQDMSVSNDYGVISGTLELPAGCPPFTTVLILAGSGPTNRDGNSVPGGGVDTLKMLAEALADNGIASVRYDKGGIAKSVRAAPAREEDMTFDMYVNDAKLWIEAMRQNPQIGHVVVAGHSEGAMIGMLAAKQVPVEGYVSLAGIGRKAGVVLREQLGRQLTDPDILAKVDHVIAELDAGRTVAIDDLPASLQSLFRPSVQPYLISWMKYDAADEIRSLTTPTLIAQGTTDIQVTVEDAQALSAAKPDATLVIVEEMMHELKHATLDNASEQRAYTDPSLPLVPELVDHTVDFVHLR